MHSLTADIASRKAITIEELFAKTEITELVTAYAYTVDGQRWRELEEIFSDDMTIEMPFASHQGKAGLGNWAKAALSSFEKTHHQSSNIEIVLNGALLICGFLSRHPGRRIETLWRSVHRSIFSIYGMPGP